MIDIILCMAFFAFKTSPLPEGVFFNSWLKGKLLDKNKNVLMASTGDTGSGKSYWNLASAHLYYKEVLKKPFPIENVIFSPLACIQRLRYFEENQMSGELLIGEEWGVNNSNLNWQSKTQRILGYVMQSFRSMNIGILFTLPVLTMLNKQTRQLLHAHFVTAGIDFQEKTVTMKPLMHQLNQTSGHSFWKYPKVMIGGSARKLKRLSVHLPPQELIDAYEKKKAQFVSKQLSDAERELMLEEEKGAGEQKRELLTDPQYQAYKLRLTGLTHQDIADKIGVTRQAINDRLQQVKRKGYSTEELDDYMNARDAEFE